MVDDVIRARNLFTDDRSAPSLQDHRAQYQTRGGKSCCGPRVRLVLVDGLLGWGNWINQGRWCSVCIFVRFVRFVRLVKY